MTNPKFSVLIIVHGRKDHLLNVVRAVELSSVRPAEIVVIHMNEPAYEVASVIPVKQHELQSDEPLPLAAARNKAAAYATSDMLCFLDVDCIPDRTYFEDLLRDAQPNTLTMADPRYLATTIEPTSPLNFDELRNDAHINPVRVGLPYGASNNYEQFWSLGFAISKPTFALIDGFDESFKGYGGEDTDFAITARERGVGLFFSHAQIFHQPHPEYDPPLNWLEDIITNAVIFKRKWNEWPMQGWLHEFEKSGYISMDDNSIELLRLPTDEEITRSKR